MIPHPKSGYLCWISVATGEALLIHYVDVAEEGFQMEPSWAERYLPVNLHLWLSQYFPSLLPSGWYVETPDFLRPSEYILAYASLDLIDGETGNRLTAREFGFKMCKWMQDILDKEGQEPWFTPAGSTTGLTIH